MEFGGICITTNNAPRLAQFYKIVLQKEPFVEGSHYGFGKIAIYDPGGINTDNEKNIWLQCFTANVDALYERLLREIPGIEIISPPERREWGAYSFQFADPDGNKIAVAQK
ncbi:MAG: VOC family protein [Clostridiales bacterium]|jgi:predicted enzyme related to lactoylglutathione lyase|nr:VOC family protein [Clostridiales bacterium]